MREHLGENTFTAVGAWIQHWTHSGGYSIISERCVGPGTYMSFLHCTELICQSRARAYISCLFDDQTRLKYIIQSCKFKWQYHSLWWMAYPSFRKEDVRIEMRARTHKSARLFGG